MAAQSIGQSRSRRMVNWKPSEWAWCWTLLLLFVRFFTQFSTVTLYVIYTAGMLMLVLLHMNRGRRAFAFGDGRLHAAMLGLCFSVLVIVTFSPYNKEQLVKFCLLIMDAYILVGVMGVREVEGATKVFYWASMVVVVLTFAVYLVQPSYFSTIEGSYQGLFYSPVFFGVPDNNDTAVVMFLLACIAYKKRWKAGVVLGCVYPFLYFGRQYILMVLVVLAITAYLTVKPKSRAWKSLGERFAPGFFYLLFVVSTVCLILLAYFWVGFVAGNDTSSYKESLNDSSNAIRMNSDVYCFELMLGDPEFLIYGYDSDVYDELGISSTDYSSEANYLIDGKYRLVQPHEEVLNMVLKEGLLFAVFYYWVVSRLLSRISWGTRGKAILFAYVVGSLFLAGFFRDFRLLAFLVVAIVDEVPLRSVSLGKKRRGFVKNGAEGLDEPCCEMAVVMLPSKSRQLAQGAGAKR